ncbi:hypothetical protein M011DRAFT_205574 [Sporormia fimetaria CBS 119925]|uniref:Uncharacterized protein n=1 Tax=Sporormia fimetaria CBS 119925 TaxID=1340428 RepID=A0A6A6UZY3_9PLEO|nr:hypothetical protein M011DRAFT_205574 [Sporormia fimetaria CBS 119925]
MSTTQADRMDQRVSTGTDLFSKGSTSADHPSSTSRAPEPRAGSVKESVPNDSGAEGSWLREDDYEDEDDDSQRYLNTDHVDIVHTPKNIPIQHSSSSTPEPYLGNRESSFISHTENASHPPLMEEEQPRIGRIPSHPQTTAIRARQISVRRLTGTKDIKLVHNRSGPSGRFTPRGSMASDAELATLELVSPDQRTGRHRRNTSESLNAVVKTHAMTMRTLVTFTVY